MKKEFKMLLALLMSISILAVFWKVTTFDFLCIDDYEYVLENPYVNTGLSFKNIYFVLSNSWAANWHPLTFISHMADVEFFGINAGHHHLINLIIHIINALLLLFVLEKMTGAFWRSLAVSFLFAFHPMHVESVAWISERKDLLCTFFFLMTILYYYKKTENNNDFNRAMTLIMLILGLLSKPMIITLPFVLILIDYWPLNRLRFEKKAIGIVLKEKLLFFFLVAGSSIITYISQKNYGAISASDIYPMGAKISNAILSYGKYIAKLFYPVNLSIIYPLNDEYSQAATLLTLFVLMGLTLFFIFQYKKKPYLIVGWFWFLGTLVPVIGIIQVGSQSMADRYSYISFIGLFIILSWGIHDIFKHHNQKKIILSFISGLVIVCCITLTSFQLDHFKNSVSLFSHAVKVTKDNYIAHYNLGVGLLNAGDPVAAIQHCKEAIRIKKGLPVAHNCLGRAYAETGEFKSAANHFKEAIAINGKYARAHYNLGQAYIKLGKIKNALSHFKEVYNVKPNYFDTYNDYGCILVRAHQMDAAAIFFRNKFLTELILTDIDPESPIKSNRTNGVPLFKKALELARKNKTAEATHTFNSILTEGYLPRELFNNFGVVNVMQNRLANSVRYFQEAVRIDPAFSEAYNNWGAMLLQAGKNSDALSCLQKAIQLKKDPIFYNNMGILFAGMGKLEEALENHLEAYAIDSQNQKTCYLIASIYAVKKDISKAEVFLKQAVDNGFSNRKLLENDIFFSMIDLDSLSIKQKM